VNGHSAVPIPHRISKPLVPVLDFVFENGGASPAAPCRVIAQLQATKLHEKPKISLYNDAHWNYSNKRIRDEGSKTPNQPRERPLTHCFKKKMKE
jgi:hypothetical protein